MNLTPVSPAPVRRLARGAPLRVLKEQPENLETRLSDLSGWMVPASAFYRRNHFAYPRPAGGSWHLSLDGRLARSLHLSLADLARLEQTSLWAVLECAGNKRSGFSPPAEGEPWGPGAVGQAEWGGVPLRTLLAHAGLAPEAAHVIFTGADEGRHPATGEHVAYARSLPLAKALHPDTLLALTMNGEPLPHVHGGPVRLLVPGWYGMASVKWLRRITLSDQPCTGPFQTRDYVYHWAAADPGVARPAVPVTELKVQAVIVHPPQEESPGAVLPPGRVVVRGLAWAGEQPLARVEVSLDAGVTWAPAELLPPMQERYAWRLWQYAAELPPGVHKIAARATDAAGDKQPWEAPWNVKGYGNNAIARVAVRVGRVPRGSWLLQTRPPRRVET